MNFFRRTWEWVKKHFHQAARHSQVILTLAGGAFGLFTAYILISSGAVGFGIAFGMWVIITSALPLYLIAVSTHKQTI